VEQTGVKIDIEGRRHCGQSASVDEAAAQRAMDIIGKIVEVPEVGKVLPRKVVKIMEFGAFVQILPARRACCTFRRSLHRAESSGSRTSSRKGRGPSEGPRGG